MITYYSIADPGNEPSSCHIVSRPANRTATYLAPGQLAFACRCGRLPLELELAVICKPVLQWLANATYLWGSIKGQTDQTGHFAGRITVSKVLHDLLLVWILLDSNKITAYHVKSKKICRGDDFRNVLDDVRIVFCEWFHYDCWRFLSTSRGFSGIRILSVSVLRKRCSVSTRMKWLRS